tara:strand:+ start:549 stop:1220 length:672 start_codon:yes stop_codon:yes gene_type:complete
MNFINDFIFKFKWYLKNRFKINRSGRVKEASEEFNEYINSLPRGSFVIDVGANVGKFTNIFLKKEFKVHAFEPDPIAVNELNKNCGDNNENLKLFEVAVGIKKESKKLYRYRKFDAANPETTIGSSVLSFRSGKDKPFVEIKCINFIDYLKNIENKIALLKMDIEGAEVEILEKIIDERLHKKIGKIYAETHERFSHRIAVETVNLRLRLVKENINNINLNWG